LFSSVRSVDIVCRGQIARIVDRLKWHMQMHILRNMNSASEGGGYCEVTSM